MKWNQILLVSVLHLLRFFVLFSFFQCFLCTMPAPGVPDPVRLSLLLGDIISQPPPEVWSTRRGWQLTSHGHLVPFDPHVQLAPFPFPNKISEWSVFALLLHLAVRVVWTQGVQDQLYVKRTAFETFVLRTDVSSSSSSSSFRWSQSRYKVYVLCDRRHVFRVSVE